MHMIKARTSGKNCTVLFIAILAAMAAVRLYHIGTAPLEIEESWRQSDTESIARNFVQYRFNILYPNFNYDGPLPNVPALEFQVTTFAIAILYKLFGFSYVWARLVPVFFFMISAGFLFAFTRRHLGQAGALFCLLAYGFIPINVYYSRAIMPEAAGLMFFIGSLCLFDSWITSGKLLPLLLSSLSTALAIMTKPMTVFVTIPMLYLLVKQYRWRWLLKKELWGFAMLAFGLAFFYYYYSISIADYKFAQGLAQNVLLKKLPAAVFDPESYLYIGRGLVRLLTPPGLILACIGLFCFTPGQRVMQVWFAAMALELILVVTVIHIHYYFIFFAVTCSILIGQGLAHLYGRLQTRVFAVIMLVMLILSSYLTVKPMYTVNEALETQVKVVRKLTEKDDLLITGSLDPCLLGLSGRRGWRFNTGIYSGIPADDLEELRHYIKNGAKYFVPIQGSIYGDDKGDILRYLEENHERIEPVKGYPVYKLQ